MADSVSKDQPKSRLAEKTSDDQRGGWLDCKARRTPRAQQRWSWVSESVWDFAGKLFHKAFYLFGTVKKSSIQPELRVKLMDYYRDDIREVEELIGRDLSAWQ